MSYDLILHSSTPIATTPDQTVDVRSALVRGLAHHIRRVSWDQGQVGNRFTKVEEYLATYTDPAEFPAACCYPRGSGQYDDAGSIGNDVEDCTTFALLYWGDFTTELELECYFTSPANRRAAMMALENACVPVEWLRGFRMVLTDYFGAVGEYSVVESTIEDIADDRTKGWYKVTFTFKAKAPLYRRIDLPRLSPAAQTVVGETA